MPTRDFSINRDAFITDASGGAGAGDGWTLNAGLYSGNLFRILMKFNLNFDNMTDINSAVLKMKTATECGWAYPSGPRVKARRCTQGWNEGESGHHGTDKITWSTSNAVTWSNQPNVDGTTTPAKTVSGGTGASIEIDVTDIVKAWAPKSITGGDAKANYGLRVFSDDESNSAQRLEIWSKESNKFDAYIRVDYENNFAPAAPTDLIPGGEEHPVLASTSGTTGTFTGRFIDPDPGDTLSNVHFELHDAASTDATPIMLSESYHPRDDPNGATITNTTFSIPKTGLVLAREYRWRARCKDNEGKWGPKSPLADVLFRAVASLKAPTGLSVDADTATPYHYGNISGNDPNAYITATDIEVLTAPTSGSPTTKWAAGPVDLGGSLKRFQVAYGGDTLSPGLRYQWRVRVRDQYLQWSPWSAFQTWTYVIPTGPATMTPKNNTLVTTTPTMSVSHSSAFDARQLEISASEGGGDVVYAFASSMASTTGPVTHVVPSGELNPGAPYWWRAAIRPTGTSDYGPWSDWLPFRTDSAPLKSDVVSPGSRQQSTAQPIGTRLPLYTAVYADAELETDGDYPTERIIRIKRTSDNVVLETNTDTAPVPYTVPMQYQAAVQLALDTAYYQTWEFKDQLGVSSGESERFYFRHSSPPVLTFAGPATPLTDPTPLLSWSATYTGGRSQQAYRVLITQAGDPVLDTGWVDGNATTYQVQPGTLDTGLTTVITVSIRDDDRNEVSQARTVTTTFTVPATPTTFVAVPVISDSSVDLSWTDVAGLDYWIIRRKATDGNLVTIGLAYPGDPTYRDYGAQLGVDLEYELTAYNGWAESLPATASAILETLTPGSSVVVTEEFAIELWQVTDAGSDFAPFQEVMQPIGRANPVVESLAAGVESGTMAARIPPEDRWQVHALRSLAGAVDTNIWVKDRYGGTYRVAVGVVRRVPLPDGLVEVSAAWVKVGD